MNKEIKQGYKQTKVGIIPEDWEVKTFQSIFERVTRKNTVNNQNVLTISAQHGLVNQEDFFNKSVSSEDLSGYILLNKGEFAYNKSYSNGYPMGAIKRLKKYDQGVVSSLYIYFKAIKDDPEFYEHYFEAGLLNREIYKIAQEGARNHGLLNMSVIEFFKDLHVAKPPKIEQQKIAQILTTWDETIVKQEKLIKEKEQLKKGLIQKLLSGEVRFQGFDEDWKFVKLGDLLDYLQPTQYLVSDTNYSDEYETPVLTAGKTFILGYTNETEGIFEDNLPVIIFDDFTTATQFVDFPFKAKSSAMKILKPKNKSVNVKLVYEIMQMINFIADDHKRYWISEYQELEIKLPSKEEQLKISEFLNTINDEINLLKNELEELKLQKKALMQKLLTGQVRVKV
ncbi:restriction endonuclease subunit S [Aliarcobacter butzleri]|uniref:restriction endonuclease subunit S n=1 Tax=Aliarcobacter butzleri TaxID=28197 RepID=UPI002B2423A1|nr:restriction endonuclease subunit S [Aliarcobacter butzleri]